MKALCEACYSKNVAIVDLLINKKADINYVNPFHFSPFDISLKTHNLHLFITLLFFGSQPSGNNIEFEKPALKSAYEDHKNKKLWSKERNKYFPFFVKSSLISLLICFKLISKNLSQIFPKPIIFLIFQIFVNGCIESNSSNLLS